MQGLRCAFCLHWKSEGEKKQSELIASLEQIVIYSQFTINVYLSNHCEFLKFSEFSKIYTRWLYIKG